MKQPCCAGCEPCAPQTLHALNDRVVELAVQAKVTKGRKLRLGATCVQTEIHHPTDSGLLVDSVRVLSCIVKKAKGMVTHQVSSLQATCRSRLRSAKQTAQRLHRQLRRKGEAKEAEQKQLYQKLIETAVVPFALLHHKIRCDILFFSILHCKIVKGRPSWRHA